MQFDERQRQAFARDGVVELGQVLAPEALDDLRRRFDRLFFPAAGEVAPAVRDLSELQGKPLTYSVMQLIDLQERDEAFHRLSRRGDILDMVEKLIGPNVQLFRDQAFYKPARHGSEVYMHQDNRYWHLEPPNAVTLWIALDEATVENGCVHFVRGSHRLGRVSHTRAANGESILLEAEADKANAEAIVVPAGHATIHHCQTLHWSPANRTDRPRRAHTVQYMGAGILHRGEMRRDLPLLRGTLPEETCGERLGISA